MEVLAITLIAALVSVIFGLLVIVYSASNIDLKKLLNSYIKLLSSKINPTSTVVKELPLSSSQNTALTLLTQKEKFIRDSFNSDVIKMIKYDGKTIEDESSSSYGQRQELSWFVII